MGTTHAPIGGTNLGYVWVCLVFLMFHQGYLGAQIIPKLLRSPDLLQYFLMISGTYKTLPKYGPVDLLIIIRMLENTRKCGIAFEKY